MVRDVTVDGLSAFSGFFKTFRPSTHPLNEGRGVGPGDTPTATLRGAGITMAAAGAFTATLRIGCASSSCAESSVFKDHWGFAGSYRNQGLSTSWCLTMPREVRAFESLPWNS